MGHYRYEDIHRTPCRCGEGYFVVDECESDHGWASADEWLEARIEGCAACSERYVLSSPNKDLVVVQRREDIANRKVLEGEARNRSAALEQSPLVQDLMTLIREQMQTAGGDHKSERKALQALGVSVTSKAYSSARKHQSLATYVSRLSVDRMVIVADQLKRHDDAARLRAEQQAIAELWRRSSEPVPADGEPVLDRRGRT